MALPLLWLGAAVLSAVAVRELNEQRDSANKRRQDGDVALTRDNEGIHGSGVEKYPNEIFNHNVFAKIRPGSLVCCGLGGVLDHTGILVDQDTIVELHGSGLVKAISPKRFLKERSGKGIFVACDSLGNALGGQDIAQRAINQIYHYQEYHLLRNNCHKFAWQCISGQAESVTTFHQLNRLFSKYFDRKIYWDKWACPNA